MQEWDCDICRRGWRQKLYIFADSLNVFRCTEINVIQTKVILFHGFDICWKTFIANIDMCINSCIYMLQKSYMWKILKCYHKVVIPRGNIILPRFWNFETKLLVTLDQNRSQNVYIFLTLWKIPTFSNIINTLVMSYGIYFEEICLHRRIIIHRKAREITWHHANSSLYWQLAKSS